MLEAAKSGTSRSARCRALSSDVRIAARRARPQIASRSSTTSLLDQSALTDLAERLVDAARKRAGADAADAVAVRSRVAVGSRCATARSRNPSAPKATMSACACSSAASRRWSRPTTSRRRRRRRWPSARSRWRASRPRTRIAGLADPALLAHEFPDLDLLDPDIAVRRRARSDRARAAEAAGLAVKGVTKSGGASASAGIGGMVLVTSHGFHGAYLGSQPRHLDDGDRRRRHRHGARLRLFLGAARRRSRRARKRSAAAPASARCERLNPRKVDDPARCR